MDDINDLLKETEEILQNIEEEKDEGSTKKGEKFKEEFLERPKKKYFSVTKKVCNTQAEQ